MPICRELHSLYGDFGPGTLILPFHYNGIETVKDTYLYSVPGDGVQLCDMHMSDIAAYGPRPFVLMMVLNGLFLFRRAAICRTETRRLHARMLGLTHSILPVMWDRRGLNNACQSDRQGGPSVWLGGCIYKSLR